MPLLEIFVTVLMGAQELLDDSFRLWIFKLENYVVFGCRDLARLDFVSEFAGRVKITARCYFDLQGGVVQVHKQTVLLLHLF